MIRPAEKADSPAINELLSQILRTHHAIRPDLFRPAYISETEYEESPDEPVFVAVDENNAVVGCLWCIIMRLRGNSLKNDREWLCIDDICVDESYRRRGVGRKLVDFAAAFAKEKGLPRIELNVYENNIDAVRFYENYGFKIQKRVMEYEI
ncbi:MAG: GNAT family N-acetyltransferase [Oscillospiraceae bacterium]|nr:GNAT family N-acetyltransferase [Oscillospiraceae bacterium]